LNNNKKGEDLPPVKFLLFHLHKTRLPREFLSKNALLYFLFGYAIIWTEAVNGLLLKKR